MSAILSIRDVQLSIGDAHILKGLSFDVPSGQVTGLAGESGSGKTMMGLAICGLQPAGSSLTGSIEYDGKNLLGLPPREMNSLRGSEIAMIFQDPSASLHPMLTVGRQITDHLRHHTGIGKAEAARQAIATLGGVIGAVGRARAAAAATAAVLTIVDQLFAAFVTGGLSPLQIRARPGYSMRVPRCMNPGLTGVHDNRTSVPPYGSASIWVREAGARPKCCYNAPFVIIDVVRRFTKSK